MKRLNKKILIIVSMSLLIMTMFIGNSKASLQGNANTHYKKIDVIANWILNIRNMEKPGEAMGLNEILNTDLTPESESNNIDVHLMRSTEYGAIAILSASGYGNPQTLQESEIKTTTGNKTGMYFSGYSFEYVSGGLEGQAPVGAHSRYYDSYTGSIESARIGDALGNAITINPGCVSWHSATNNEWVSGLPYFIRGNGGLFAYSINRDHLHIGDGGVYWARGIAVCGQGL